VIVRIATEGQYEISEGDLPSLHELDDAAVEACDSGDEERFHGAYAKLLALVRSAGRPVPEDDLRGSDLIMPPPDVSLAEARAEFSGEGLIPNV
jgi:hypothetical protein